MNKHLQTRWNKLCHTLAIEADQQELQRLYNAYSEPQRTYHTLQHLEECLQHLDNYQLLHPSSNHTNDDDALDYSLVEIALWYHDAIYQPIAQHNERNSAQWAIDFLSRSGVSATVCEQVDGSILATCHQQGHQQNASHNQQLLVDIDLAILGANRKRFQEYEQQVREEYKEIPRFIYRKKRRGVLQSFLTLPRIYNTQWFYAHFEQQAQQNLAFSISNLSNV
jgi:predicted metal-dependent HD superfamily phosphohydrolase